MVIDIPNPYSKRVVIIGGGFGGIELAKTLKNKENTGCYS
jgi:NADH dehydrogenase FAD-containing subunit